MNQLFGQLQIGSNRAYSYVGCTLLIGKVGISQASALVWIRDMYLPYYGYVWRTTTVFDYCTHYSLVNRNKNKRKLKLATIS